MSSFAHQLNRRELLRIGGLGVGGLTLTQLLASPLHAAPAKAKACIMLFMWGGPSQIDTWDPKPNAASEVRGEFKPISTSVPGIQISEHFPLLAKQAHRYTIIRSMTHTDPAHLSPTHHLMTGRLATRVNSDNDGASRKDTPAIGSVLSKLRPSPAGMPSFVSVPWLVSHPSAPGGQAPGQNAGYLGSAHDPFVVTGDPNAPNFSVQGLRPGVELSLERLEGRAELLSRLSRAESQVAQLPTLHQKAFQLIHSANAREAFDLSREPDRIRDRYGRHIHGQSCLMARRLIEAGVRLVCVSWHQDGQSFWDTHGNNFPSLKTRLMPFADRGFSALLEDLSDRGMLDETLVVQVGEFGRAPKVNGSAGRDHWPFCYSAVMAGGGVSGGRVYGKSDRIGAYPAESPVSPSDLAATIYEAMGVDPEMTLPDREGRPIRLTEGDPIRGLFGA